MSSRRSSLSIIPAPSKANHDDFPLADYEHPMDIEKFRNIGHQVVDWMCDYQTRLHASSSTTRIKVRDPSLKPGYLRTSKLPSIVPEKGESWEALMSDFEDKMVPSATHWQSPTFFAYFPANISFPATLADMLSGALNMIGFSWAAGPISTELEELTLDMLGKLCGLPSRFMHYPSEGGERGKGGGVIQSTTSDAVLVSMLAAQSRAMEGRPPSDRLKLVAYASDQTHSCFKKACMILSIDHIRTLPTMFVEPALDLYDQAFALDEDTLERAIIEDEKAGLIPFFCCINVGTTSSCAVDPISELADVANKRGVWTHVDAAYAGASAICPEYRDKYFSGLERVDSVSFNPHKGLLVNFDCCAAWFSDATYVKRALSLTPIFLQGVGNQLDLKDWQVPLGRRFRSLKLYFVLRTYGSEALQQYVRHHYALAQWFARMVESDRRFELASKPRFGLVCFRLAPEPEAALESSNERNKALLDKINEDGSIFLIHTELRGKFTLRLAVGSAGTQLIHVKEAWDIIRSKATEI
jgi:aromatic-L-amino-acid decarboxylase